MTCCNGRSCPTDRQPPKPWITASGAGTALTRFVDDGQLPVDNNWIENQIRPIAIGRANWLFAGSLRAGQRAAAVMSLMQSARMNGHDPYAYLKDVLTRLPTHKASRIGELLPHRWEVRQPPGE
jgi:transposase